MPDQLVQIQIVGPSLKMLPDLRMPTKLVKTLGVHPTDPSASPPHPSFKEKKNVARHSPQINKKMERV